MTNYDSAVIKALKNVGNCADNPNRYTDLSISNFFKKQSQEAAQLENAFGPRANHTRDSWLSALSTYSFNSTNKNVRDAAFNAFQQLRHKGWTLPQQINLHWFTAPSATTSVNTTTTATTTTINTPTPPSTISHNTNVNASMHTAPVITTANNIINRRSASTPPLNRHSINITTPQRSNNIQVNNNNTDSNSNTLGGQATLTTNNNNLNQNNNNSAGVQSSASSVNTTSATIPMVPTFTNVNHSSVPLYISPPLPSRYIQSNVTSSSPKTTISTTTTTTVPTVIPIVPNSVNASNSNIQIASLPPGLTFEQQLMLSTIQNLSNSLTTSKAIRIDSLKNKSQNIKEWFSKFERLTASWSIEQRSYELTIYVFII